MELAAGEGEACPACGSDHTEWSFPLVCLDVDPERVAGYVVTIDRTPLLPGQGWREAL
jgi:hypothetical protein